MDCIVTKYLGPTNTKGSRIKATGFGLTVIKPYRHVFSGVDCHLEVALDLAKKAGLTGTLVVGEIKGGYAFTFIGGRTFKVKGGAKHGA
jgi:hypothetical protein